MKRTFSANLLESSTLELAPVKTPWPNARMSAIQFEDATSISYEVSEGEDVKLACPTNEPAYFTALSFEHPPVPSFFLAPDGKKIIQEGQTFIISNVTQWNTGTYTCVVKDKELNNAELQVADVIVKSPKLEPQDVKEPDVDEKPAEKTAAMNLKESKPYVFFKQKSPYRINVSGITPLELSFKAKGLQPIKIQWRKDNLELMIGSRFKTFDHGRQLLVQPPFSKDDSGTYSISACNVKGCSVKGVQVIFYGGETDGHLEYSKDSERPEEKMTFMGFVRKYGFLGIPSVLVIILIIAIACASGRRTE
ncbi:uncharacterized protein [Montipora capricornis]|uniref:uncharacterized protein n=1 Tax=Montipora capricornis TaxID=246305 RepID=UPI0035F19C70